MSTQETERELKEYLQECGILQAWQALLKVLVQNGFPEENVYDFAADEILKFGEEWKKTHTQFKKPSLPIQSKSEQPPAPPDSPPPIFAPASASNEKVVNCLKCGQLGHQARDCTIQESEEEQQEEQHIVESEPSNKDPESPRDDSDTEQSKAPGYTVHLTDDEKDQPKMVESEGSESYDESEEDDSDDDSDDLPSFEPPRNCIPIIAPSITVTPPSPPLPQKMETPRQQPPVVEEEDEEDVVYVDEDGNIIPKDEIGSDHEIISEDEYLASRRSLHERVIYVDENGNQIDAEDIDDYDLVDDDVEIDV